jgi:hypothetical protein
MITYLPAEMVTLASYDEVTQSKSAIKISNRRLLQTRIGLESPAL